MLAAATVVWGSQLSLTTRSAVPFALPEVLLPTHGAVPLVDLSPNDDETARLTRSLKDRVTDAGGAVGSRAFAPIRFSSTLLPAAVMAPTGRIAFSLGPRAPPPARNDDSGGPEWLA